MLKMDTGAKANVINKSIAIKIGAKLKPSNARLLGYGRTPIQNHGRIQVKVRRDDCCKSADFEVVDDGLPPILGLQSSVKFGLVKNVNTLSQCVLDEFVVYFKRLDVLQQNMKFVLIPLLPPCNVLLSNVVTC